MSDYLTNLVLRTLSPAATVRPQLPSAFEPPGLVPRVDAAVFGELDVLTEASPVATPRQPVPGSPGVVSFPPPVADEPKPIRTELPPRKSSTPASENLKSSPADEIPLREAAAGRPKGRRPEPAVKEMSDQADSPVRISSRVNVRPMESVAPVASTQRISMARVAISPPTPAASVPRQRAAPAAPAIRAVIPPARPVTQNSPPVTPPVPMINVTIGRVEVRAVPAAAGERARPKTPLGMSLESYLQQRAHGGPR